jgi:hypothetical protein
VERLKAAYPEGVYTFAGATAGERYASEATLSHALPPAAGVVTPADEAEGVAVTGVRVTWTPVPGVASYVVTLEQPICLRVTVDLPAGDSFAVPTACCSPTRHTLPPAPPGRRQRVVQETTFATAPGTSHAAPRPVDAAVRLRDRGWRRVTRPGW